MRVNLVISCGGLSERHSYRMGPSFELAFSTKKSGWNLWIMVHICTYNELVNGVYKLTNITGGSHPVGYVGYVSIVGGRIPFSVCDHHQF